MPRIPQLFVLLIILATEPYAVAQNQTPKTQAPPKTQVPARIEDSFSLVLHASILHLQRIMMPMAMAMPADKYDFAPTGGEFKGVRTFAEQLKHVGATNFTLAAAILGENPPAEAGDSESGPPSVKAKEQVLTYLNHSFSYVQKAVATIDAKNVIMTVKSPFGGEATRLAMTTLIISNCYDHYGQLTQYLRMNGIVPPASQRE